MADRTNELNLLFNQIDDWFTDLGQPISQFDLSKDRAKLAVITRTTNNWFYPLKNRITSDGIHEKTDLDTLAKNLELLLDIDYYFYNLYASDEDAILDKSIGYCCTLKDDSSSDLSKQRGLIVMPTAQEDNNQPQDVKSVNNLSVQTPMPLDHDYLPRPRPPPCDLKRSIQNLKKSLDTPRLTASQLFFFGHRRRGTQTIN